MMVECDEVAVDSALWDGAVKKNPKAVAQLKQMLDGLVIYFHALPVAETEKVVTVRQISDLLNLPISLTIGWDG